MSDLSYLLGESSPVDSLSKLQKLGAKALANEIVNNALNTMIHNADDGGIFGGSDDGRQHIPYTGWYWRDVDFFGDWGVTIASTPDGTVVCESNKWGYEQRSLTPDEHAEFVRLVWIAHTKSRLGGSLADIRKGVEEALDAAGAYIQGLSVEVAA